MPTDVVRFGAIDRLCAAFLAEGLADSAVGSVLSRRVPAALVTPWTDGRLLPVLGQTVEERARERAMGLSRFFKKLQPALRSYTRDSRSWSDGRRGHRSYRRSGSNSGGGRGYSRRRHSSFSGSGGGRYGRRRYGGSRSRSWS
jgi:hypothetical protein